MPGNRNEGGTIQSVQTALRVLNALKEKDSLRVSTLAEELGTSDSTAHRYLKTLTQEGYLRREGGTYKIGLRFLSLGVYARSQQYWYEMVKQKVDQIAEDTGERSQYMVPEHGKAVYLHQALGSRAVHIGSEIGDRVPLHATAPGKAILAAWPEERAEQYVKERKLGSFTGHTITDADTLLRELETIRKKGFSRTRQEYIEELNAVGVAIEDPRGRVLGAIGMSGPTHRMHGNRLENDMSELIMGTAHEIEVNMKYAD